VVKLRVKLGAAEAEVEADLEHLKEAIDLLPELMKKLPAGEAPRIDAQAVQRQVATSQVDQRTQPSSLPLVTVEKSDSLADIIIKFFADPWGRERRKLLDVRDTLQSYGLNYPKQSVAVALLRLAKTTKIRRFKAEDGEYVYTSSTGSFSAPVQSTIEPPPAAEVASETATGS
jgi:hypothetical protein